MALKTHGISAKTPEQLLLGAGAYYKNLKYTEGSGWEGEILGATQDGGKVTIEPEYLDIEADGATVKVRGLTQKVGEVATMEVNLLEFKEENLINALHMVEDSTEAVEGYKTYVSKRTLSDSDYFENIAYVGTLTNGKQVIVVFENALLTGAMELEPKNKEVSVMTITAECYATFEQDDLEHLPYKIYYPQGTSTGI